MTGTEPRPDPVLEATFELALRVWNERAELRERFGDPSNLGYWFWLLDEGTREVPELASTFYPVPDPALLERVLGDEATAEQYRESGRTTAYAIFRTLDAVGFQLEGRRVLDFGCGCGRVRRPFARFGRSSRFHGVDIDAQAVAWCRENLTFADFGTVGTLPPTELPDGAFDAVYSFSVFSHLPEDANLAWLEELKRVVAPGGYLLLTVHGRTCVERFLAESTQLDHPTGDELRARLPELERHGFAFFRFPFLASEHAENAEWAERTDLDLYGNAFVTRDWIERRWTEGAGLELVRIDEAPDGWQDFVLLRRPE